MIRRKNSTRGFTLIEVLIAVLLLAIGVLGLAGLQLKSLKFNQAASGRSQATFLAYSVADAMRANRPAALAGNYNIALTGTPVATPTTIAQTDVKNWRTSIASQLPAGVGSIAQNGNTVTIRVQWNEGRADGNTDSSDDVTTFTVVTEI